MSNWEGNKIEIGLVNKGDVSVDWAMMFNRLLLSFKGSIKVYLYKTYNIDIAREKVVDEALKDGFEKILFLDTDIFIRPEDIAMMYNQHYPIVTGVYWNPRPKESGGSISNLFVKDKDGILRPVIDINPIKGNQSYVDGAGFGCIMIDSKVFTKVSKPWFIFHDPPGMSEDIYFCDKANKEGFKVLADGRVLCRHEKRVRFLFNGELDL